MLSILDSIQAVLFDIGSTLVMGPSISPNKEVVKHFALKAELAAQISRMIMCTDFKSASDVCDLLRRCGVQVNKDDGDFLSRLWHDQETGAMPIPGALDAVRFFKEAGKTVGLLSDIWPPYYHAFTSACPEINELAEVKQLSFQAGMKKPEAAFFQSALRALKSAPERVLMIGDTYDNDIAPAIRQGMKTAWILSRAEREVPALAGVIQGRLPRPDLTLASIVELQSAVIQELFSGYQNT
ncbi:MAG: HAD family hydrolase [Candidatus Angelobacter sp.]